MPYIDQVYYSDNYYGKMPKSPSELPRLISRAEDIIDSITGGKSNEVMSMVDPVGAYSQMQTAIRKATCVQVEHFVINGGYDKSQKTSSMSNVRLGSFNYSDSKNQSSDQATNKQTPDTVFSLLGKYGLLYNGVDTNG